MVANGEVDSLRDGWHILPLATYAMPNGSSEHAKRNGVGQWSLAVAKPAEGFVACFAEGVTGTIAIPAFYSTNLPIVAAQAKQLLWGTVYSAHLPIALITAPSIKR